MPTIKAIETVYSGYRFRSRLEARWATFFTALGLRWEYEKEGYDLGESGWYLPDFWLPDVGLRRDTTTGLWIEIKPEEPTDEESKKCHALGANDSTVILFVGLPGEYPDDSGYQYDNGWDNYMRIMRCYNSRCNYTKIEFMEGNYCYCPKCNSHADEDHPDIERAVLAAKSARFEHGQRGYV
jgi:hypothetical protein